MTQTYDAFLATDELPGPVYVLVNCVSLAINSLALRILVEVYGAWYVTATVALAAISAPDNFIAHRALSYRVDAIS